MKFIATFVVFGAVLSATPAYADMFCVQRELANLGYQPGPVDGAFGGKTASAAAAYATDFAATLPALDKSNSDPWCAALTATAATPEGIARRFDVTSPPSRLLSQAATNKLWDMYKHINECLKYDLVPGSAHVPFSMQTVKTEALAATPWQTPFSPTVIGSPSCKVSAPNFGVPPVPVPVVKLDEAYGERVQSIDNAMSWFRLASTYVRMTGDPVARSVLKSTLLEWARSDSMGKGIRVSWGKKPVDYQMNAAIMGLLAATAEIIPDITADDQTVIGPWLQRLVKIGAESNYRDQADNKTLMTAYVSLLWGIIIDDRAIVQEAIDAYKRGLHFMRPDGSFPVDTQRGGMGIQYNSVNVSYLIQIASAIERTYGIDLFAYSADGRSIHNAVDFMVRSIKAPGETNAIYAISCPDSGDRWGTIDNPSTGFIDFDSTIPRLYADRFPEEENSVWIKANLKLSQPSVTVSERSGGAAICQFAALTDAVFTGPPIEVPGVVVVPTPKLVITTKEEIANQSGPNPLVNSLFTSRVAGASGGGGMSYNVKGRFNIFKNTFYSIVLVINEKLTEKAAAGITACGYGYAIARYEDNEPRLELWLRSEDGAYVMPSLDCVRPHLTPRALATAELLRDSFQDIAIGMVKDGSAGLLGHEGLRVWMEKVALGEVVLR